MKLQVIQNCPKFWYMSINITILKYFDEKRKKKTNPHKTPNLS